MAIKPYGGKLINLFLSDEEKPELLKEIGGRKFILDGCSIVLNSRQESDLFLLACGAYSPLNKFMNYETYNSVLQNLHLPNGLPWTIPITLNIKEEKSNKLKINEKIFLIDKFNRPVALMTIEEKFKINKNLEAKKIYRTEDSKHPGVNYLLNSGKISLSGEIKYFGNYFITNFIDDEMMPQKSRNIFEKSGWKTIAAFQTRNPLHRGHEFLLQTTLNFVDGIFLHPLVGKTAKNDLPADIRIQCYKKLLQNYYSRKQIIFSIFPASMRYAGPMEAVFHAIVRQNYGCTHFIVGRDHAGFGNYYDEYDSQKIFSEIDSDKLNIKPIFFENAFYCNLCKKIVTKKICTHNESNHTFLSGRKIREIINEGKIPPEEFIRPELAEILINYNKAERNRGAKRRTTELTDNV